MKTLKPEKIVYTPGADATRYRQCIAYAKFLREHGIKNVYLPPRLKNERCLANLWRRQLLAALLDKPGYRDYGFRYDDTIRRHHTRMQVRLEGAGYTFIEWVPECEEITS